MTMGGLADTCPRCGAAMVERRNRQDGTAFLGCTRFPDCRGTRALSGAKAVIPTGPPAQGGWGDSAQRITAQVAGRTLGPAGACLVRVALIVVVVVLFITVWPTVAHWLGGIIAGQFVQQLATPAPS